MQYDENLKGRCILSAEDNDVNQLVLKHTLEEQSVPFVIVNNGQEAIEAWEALEPKMILMDVSMPVLDGLQAIQIIREREKATGKRVPITVLTAHALKGDAESFVAWGADYYLSKPANPSKLLEHVHNVLEKRIPDSNAR